MHPRPRIQRELDVTMHSPEAENALYLAYYSSVCFPSFLLNFSWTISPACPFPSLYLHLLSHPSKNSCPIPRLDCLQHANCFKNKASTRGISQRQGWRDTASAYCPVATESKPIVDSASKYFCFLALWHHSDPLSATDTQLSIQHARICRCQRFQQSTRGAFSFGFHALL